MTPPPSSAAARLSNEDLVAEVKRLVRCERDTTAQLIAHLAELDARRLFLAAGFSSLFGYCTGALRLSEAEAYNRIEAARAARKFPVILGLLSNGSVNLTTIRLLAPHLSDENHEELLAAASGRSWRQVEELLAGRYPSPAVPSSVRKLPEPKPAVAFAAALPDLNSLPPATAIEPAPSPLQPSRRAVVAPLATDQYKISFTARAEMCRKLRLAQDLLRHQVPDGDPAEIFDRALSALLEDLARKKLAATDRPRPGRGSAPGSRHVPAAVKRAVWLRDGGRCAFVAKSGRRCHERAFLEFHHIHPHAEGGAATLPEHRAPMPSPQRVRGGAPLRLAPTRSRTSSVATAPPPRNTSEPQPPAGASLLMTRRCVLAKARGANNGLRAERDSLLRSERGFKGAGYPDRGAGRGERGQSPIRIPWERRSTPLLTQDDGRGRRIASMTGTSSSVTRRLPVLVRWQSS